MSPSRSRSAIVRLLAALGASLLFASGVAAAGPSVVVLQATGTVDNVMAGYIADGVAGAQRSGAAAVVIELDTPGGSLESTQRIVTALLEAKIPTIVWVAPAGARAASAGTFITLAAHLAYMAPGTNIGAASPVDQNGGDITGTLGQKVKNDAEAKIRAIAQERGRNIDWAVSTVESARSSPAQEAVALKAVDGLASNLDQVLAAATGRQLTIDGTPVTLQLAGASIVQAGMNPFQGLLHLLSDPNIAFLLFTIGFYGLLAEIWHPNFVTGILGALMIILGLVGFGSLPLNIAGLLLIALAVLLFALEPTVTSHGLLAVGGAVCFVLGASALYTAPSDPTQPIARVALPLIVVMTTTTAGFAFLVAWFGVRSRRIGATAFAGEPGAVIPAGTVGVVRRDLGPTGIVHAAGEDWSARTADGSSVERGREVRVVATDGLVLVVEPKGSSSRSVRAVGASG
jgi:membrane-bound serine protease (ClpP class)